MTTDVFSIIAMLIGIATVVAAFWILYSGGKVRTKKTP